MLEVKLNGLDLFSGIGGISIALNEWVNTVAYCERDRYAQSVLLSRMACGDLDWAPIWDDVTTLRGDMLPRIDIIFGGFPCQDISVAGAGKGLDGQRSGLFFEIVRLAKEIKPPFIFLENVPAIRTRGLDRVIQELTEAGYDCRWTMLSAAEVGANHKRERWFILAHPSSTNSGNGTNVGRGSDEGWTTTTTKSESLQSEIGQTHSGNAEPSSAVVAHAKSNQSGRLQFPRFQPDYGISGWWKVEPNVGRVANGIPCRVDRLKCLGNAVVPLQAKEAFKELMGIKHA